ncbi:helix-turn-helix domain-containing protein [Neisseria animalis]|uniref:Helix-turn-helix domain-containing protein n=1 Tax=Neisseria animalis TaxID=492 RepID=A0A5P3MSH4_NEIAN|nr:helix-turn-helix domain-containing protein [Neisseria animalis]QEY23741.1 helix-turn-helix domain-containing protein [Neisseria animalis]ROW32917.1 helix-turn-helix domain-containing protein [Neisseria animalis]VEE09597.1 putative zinc finger/helix-turn-helix protein, YgiT family [Neisseria animalis]
MKSFDKIDNIREIRKKLGLNQIDFWNKIGVTQSGGSRYESGRNMPKPVRELLRLVHIEQVDLAKVSRDDLAVAALLKERNPELYAELKKEAKSGKK